nr:hypothetical protein [Holophaga foetida]
MPKGQVVVGPGVQGLDLVLLLAPGADDNDRGGAALPQRPSKLQAIPIREPQIQQDHIRAMDRHHILCLSGGAGLQNAIAMGGQRGPEIPDHLRFVIHHEDLIRHGR